MIWISPRLALAIHDRQLAEHGGKPGVRDPGLLESALARPQQLHAYTEPKPDLAALAASLASGLVGNMPFVSGNKRTAHVCYRVFLSLNSARAAHSIEAEYLHILGLASGAVSEPEFVAWLRGHAPRWAALEGS